MVDKVTLGVDSRLKKDAADGSRGDRQSADILRENTDGTVADKMQQFRENFRNEWSASALPTPPAIQGFHLCWLSTTNSYDPIHKRMRIGYEPVSMAEVPGFEHYKMNGGEFDGLVGCNEMVLFKLPMELYNEMMSYYHHEKPLEDEIALKQNPALQDQQARAVVDKAEQDGFGTIVRNERTPKFS